MEENIRKVSKIRLLAYSDSAVKRGRIHRFAKWCSDQYDISWRGIYESFRGSNTSAWKWDGIEKCIQEFHSSDYENTGKFWNECKKNKFAEFMKEKGMSRGTLWKRFGADDWNRLELKGIKASYEWWLEHVEPKD